MPQHSKSFRRLIQLVIEVSRLELEKFAVEITDVYIARRLLDILYKLSKTSGGDWC